MSIMLVPVVLGILMVAHPNTYDDAVMGWSLIVVCGLLFIKGART